MTKRTVQAPWERATRAYLEQRRGLPGDADERRRDRLVLAWLVGLPPAPRRQP
jgi:hypothetical protein